MGEISALESRVRENSPDTLAMLSNPEIISQLVPIWTRRNCWALCKRNCQHQTDAGSWEIAGTTFVLCLQQ